MNMEKREHPAVQRSLLRGLATAWISAAVCFALALYLLRHGYETVGWAFAAAFGLVIVCALFYAFWRIHRVNCPQCGERAPTKKDKTGNWWIATCDRCKIEWDLNTSVD
jgi:cytosine/uracil/thiamine/allantoin permease